MRLGTGVRSAVPALMLAALWLVTSGHAVAAPVRAQGPCDIYGAAGTPCVAAHSTTRALYAGYSGPLYQVKRESDGKTLDIGVASASASDAGGYADAAAQDSFCANALCVINVIYDQSGKGNDLTQAPPGTFKGPAKGGFDTQPIADMAPVVLNGHKVYGVFIMPGMGMRNNDARGLAINDEAEGIYYVIDGTHFDSGCCFDYGNASTNGRAVGTGTMETTYFGTSTVWGSGNGPGPWIMSDMEAGLFSGQNAKQNVGDPTIDNWRFVTAVMDGGGGNKWDLRGGNAQEGRLSTFYSGVRPAPKPGGGYFPMRKQGGVLLGTGGDNGNGSSGTFYEGVMTTGYPSEATTDAVQANIVAARYAVKPVSLSRVTSFTPGVAQTVTATFTNSTGAAASGVRVSLAAPDRQWKIVASGSKDSATTVAGPIAPGASVKVTFNVTAPQSAGAGVLAAKADWKDARGATRSDSEIVRVRNVPQVRLNEVQLSSGANATDQFIELYNASAAAVDISRWSVVGTASQWAPMKVATVPAGTTLPAHGFYLLALAGSGLAAPAEAGATAIQVWKTEGFAPGQQIDIDGESRKIASVGSAAAAMTTLFIPVSTAPRMSIPAGSTKLPVASAAGFVVGEKVGIDVGGQYEETTVTAVGKAGTQTTLAAAAHAGSSNIKLVADADISEGDELTIGTGDRKEVVKVGKVGEAGANGVGVDLAAPLKFDHAATIDVSDLGTGLTVSPATRFAHIAGDAVQALGSGVTLDRPLSAAHPHGAPVVNVQVAKGGYQGTHRPNQWFGSPLSTASGSIALMDQTGLLLVDAIVYGSLQSNSSANGTIATPEVAVLEGDQRQGGCIVLTPAAGKSAGRFPDGADKDSNCSDFHLQAAATLAAGASAGAKNIKVSTVEGFAAGQKVMLGNSADHESVVVASVGSAGATTLTAATAEGATVVPVANAMAFRPGQAILVGASADEEAAEVLGAGRRGAPEIRLAAPLKHSHAAGSQLSGTGITLAAGLAQGHEAGVQVWDRLPTPGQPNDYAGDSQ